MILVYVYYDCNTKHHLHNTNATSVPNFADDASFQGPCGLFTQESCEVRVLFNNLITIRYSISSLFNHELSNALQVKFLSSHDWLLL